MSEATAIADQPERHRYEMRVGDNLVGFAAYFDRDDGVRVLPHVEIDPAFEGRGLGGVLTQYALDDCRAQGWLIVASCPFVAAWIRGHPDYAELVAPRADHRS